MVILKAIAKADSGKTATNFILVQIDNTEPSVTLTSPTGSIANTGFTVSGTMSDAQSGLEMAVIQIGPRMENECDRLKL